MSFPRRTLEGLAKMIADLKQMIQNVTIPQGTIWWFHGRTTAPVGWAICNGANGTPNLIGRYPLGATSDIGSTVEAGLPNITGTVYSNDGGFLYTPFATGYKGDNDDPSTGAFSIDPSLNPGNIRGVDASNSDRADGVLCFDASQSNSIYGRSSTVTPPSVKLLPCMKL